MPRRARDRPGAGECDDGGSVSARRERADEVLEAGGDLLERHPPVLAQVGDELGPEAGEQRVGGTGRPPEPSTRREDIAGGGPGRRQTDTAREAFERLYGE